MSEPRQNGMMQGSTRGARIRCAIYTRKSSEEGLEQEFNSLDAQREACEAYVKSQKHEGWIALPTLYDDPGYSGGTMERPALTRLLADIAARKIDTVVVYKVDRLTRSLTDFAKIVEVFDGQEVSFVSITQAFNTTTSMGRLTLNVLLSFAQFEREVTGERIRDKIAASKKKGMWMGGLPSLGYDVRDRKLIVNEVEAETVRHIFGRYLELGSVRALKSELDATGTVSKLRTAADGSAYGGTAFSRGALYLMLQNRIYRGDIVHKGAVYPGEHPRIVEEDLWAAVQRHLEANRVDRRKTDERSAPSLLTGVLFDADGEPMTPTYAVKKGTRYRYYVSRHLITGARVDKSRGQRIPAANLEGLVVKQLRSFFADPVAVLNVMPRDRRDAPSQKMLNDSAAAVVALLDQQSDEAGRSLVRLLVVRVQVFAERIDIDLSLTQLAQRLFGAIDGDSTQPNLTVDGTDAVEEDLLVRLNVPARLKRTSMEMKLVIDGDAEPKIADAGLLRILARAHLIGKRFDENANSTLEDIAARENISSSYVVRLIRLNYLAPDIVAAILAGKQPAEMTANKLMADTRLPLDWRDQRAMMGYSQVGA